MQGKKIINKQKKKEKQKNKHKKKHNFGYINNMSFTE